MGAASCVAAEARGIFERAGYVGTEPLGIGDLAIALFGRNRLTYASLPRGRPYLVQWDPPGIVVSFELDDEDLSMAIGRGIAIWWRRTREEGSDAETIEALAVALVLPDVAFRQAVQRTGGDVHAIAEEFVCPAAVVRAHMLRAGLRPTRSGTFLRLGVA